MESLSAIQFWDEEHQIDSLALDSMSAEPIKGKGSFIGVCNVQAMFLLASLSRSQRRREPSH